jgi:hypothetical protein
VNAIMQKSRKIYRQRQTDAEKHDAPSELRERARQRAEQMRLALEKVRAKAARRVVVVR